MSSITGTIAIQILMAASHRTEPGIIIVQVGAREQLPNGSTITSPPISPREIEMDYVFMPNYMDYCHPHHPDCVTGVTCTDCNDGFNPVLDFACNLVVFAANPILVGTDQDYRVDSYFNLRPNPTQGNVEDTVVGRAEMQSSTIQLFNTTGKLLEQFSWNGKAVQLDLSNQRRGFIS